MRIPPSAIVMTLLVGMPFGFAVRDTLKGNDPKSEQEREEAHARAEEQKAHDEEIKEQAAQYEREKKLVEERRSTLATLIGTTPGTLGARFGAQVGDHAPEDFDAKLSEVDHVQDHLEDGANHGLQLRGDGRITSVSFTVGSEHCSELRDVVEKAWGVQSRDVWIDSSHHRRASLSGLLCVLHFDEYADDPVWVKSVMPPLIGKTPAQAQQLLGKPTVPLDEPTLSWYLPGPQIGRDSTELRADVFDGRISSITATTNTDSDEAVRLLEAMAKHLGGPWEGGAGTYEWPKRKVAATYNDDSRFVVLTGAAAYEP